MDSVWWRGRVGREKTGLSVLKPNPDNNNQHSKLEKSFNYLIQKHKHLGSLVFQDKYRICRGVSSLRNLVIKSFS